MYDIISFVFFILGIFSNDFERMVAAWIISGLFAIAASICSLIQAMNKLSNKK